MTLQRPLQKHQFHCSKTLVLTFLGRPNMTQEGAKQEREETEKNRCGRGSVWKHTQAPKGPKMTSLGAPSACVEGPRAARSDQVKSSVSLYKSNDFIIFGTFGSDQKVTF